MARPSDEAGEAIQILVEIEAAAASKDVTRRVEDIIQPEWKPCSVTVVDQLPRTASGKVQISRKPSVLDLMVMPSNVRRSIMASARA